MVKNKYIYLIILPGILFYAIFCYGPMYGVILAFKEYRADLGILHSPFVGFLNYKYVFKDDFFWRAFFNTIIISLGRIVFQFPVPIFLAFLINELRVGKYKRVLQTVMTFPHFLSWIIVSGIFVNILGNEGALNNLISLLGIERQAFLADSGLFRSLLYASDIWKSTGYLSIIYLASITCINPEQYESAYMDGANRLQKMWYITLPGIKSTIIILLILAVGNAMNGGFDQIFNMYNPAVYNVGDIIDTYIYRTTFMEGGDFGFSTAVGLFKSIINFLLLLIADRIAKAVGEQGIF